MSDSNKRSCKKYKRSLKDQGFVRTEVWTPPDYKEHLKRLGESLRDGDRNQFHTSLTLMYLDFCKVNKIQAPSLRINGSVL